MNGQGRKNSLKNFNMNVGERKNIICYDLNALPEGTDVNEIARRFEEDGFIYYDGQKGNSPTVLNMEEEPKLFDSATWHQVYGNWQNLMGSNSHSWLNHSCEAVISEVKSTHILRDNNGELSPVSKDVIEWMERNHTTVREESKTFFVVGGWKYEYIGEIKRVL